MKKYVFIIALLLLSNLLLAETITYNYQFKKPTLETENNYTEIVYDNCYNLGKEGNPLLPYLGANIILPQNQEIENVSVVSIKYYPVQDGIKIKPAERQFPLSYEINEDYQVTPNIEIYNSSHPYPDKIIENISTHFLSGHSIASFTICPVTYIPAKNQAEFLEEITIKVETKVTNRALESEKFIRKSHKVEKRINKIVDNPEMLNTYTYPNTNRDEEYDILLISNNALLPAFDDYIEYKESTGFIVKAISTEDIYNEYPGQDSQEKIRNCVIDYYTNYELCYVLLGGDSAPNNPSDNIIPHRGLYVHTAYATDSDIPADMYYACLDGTWNNDGDSYWGEPGEEDLYAEVAIGRICVDSATEIQNQTNKLFLYQNSPVVDDIEKALMVGELLWDDPTWGGDYKDEVADGSSNHGYTTAGISDNFTITRMYERDYNWTISEIFNQFNNVGINLINHLGHSYVDYNMKMYNYHLTTANFQNDGLSHGFVIGYSQGCYNGSFDNRNDYGSYYTEDCFSEKFTTLETGEVACITNSRYGWGMHGSTNGASQYFDRQFYDAIFGEDITLIGYANGDSKEDNASYIYSDRIIRWCAYELNLFGDPSMDIWTAVPEPIVATYPSSVPIGAIQITFQTDTPFARIALVQNDELIGREVADENGNALVNFFSPIDDPEVIQVSIIGHNRTRYQGSIVVVSDQPYVIYNSHTINDSYGNNNGEPDYGEDIFLNMTLENVGNQTAYNVNAQLSGDDVYVSILDGSENVGTIEAESTVTLNDAFEIQIADNIPDQHLVNYELVITGDARDIWYSYFSIIINAPELSIGNLTIDDSAGGDGNGRLDPGETADIIIQTTNSGHCASPDATGTLNSISEYVTINSGVHDFGTIGIGATENALFNITIDSETPIGTSVDLQYTVIAGSYEAEETFNKSVGLVCEDFETGDFSSYEWEFGGNADWIVTSSGPYEGTYCSKSGSISDNQSSELLVDLNVFAGTISFYRKVSSESGYDFLRFIIDGNQQGQWAGEVSWSEVSFPVSSGMHTFKWSYEKDIYVSSGSDCAWIDYIIFPPVASPPIAGFTPEEFNFNLDLGQSGSDVLSISNSGPSNLTFSIQKDYQYERDSGGPDAFGYVWKDSDETGGPAYNWIDISEVGTLVTFNHNDQGAGPFDIGFDFDFYGITYDEFIISPNGWIGFGDDWTDWHNYSIPRVDAPKPAIFGFWDDLYPEDAVGGGGSVYYYSTSDTLIVWFDNVIHYPGANNGTYDFEMIIMSNGRIKFQYRTVTGDINSSTIGIQNESGTIGLQVAYNEYYVHDNLAVEFTRQIDWVTIDPDNGVVLPDDTQDIDITVSTNELDYGEYLCNLIITTNDPIHSEEIIPVNLIVGTQALFDISGNIGYFSDDASVPDVLLDLVGYNNYSTTTDEIGDYLFNSIPGGNYISTPSKADDLGGLSGLDASRIARYAAGLYSLDCIETIAGDVSINGYISGMDASRVARYIAGLITELNDDGIEWVFTPEPIPECNYWPPIVYENTREYSPLSSDLTDEDFIGIRLGDVSGNWSPDTRMPLAQKSLEVTEIETNTNSTLKIPIVLEDVTEIEGIDIGIAFNPEVLQLTELTLNDGILADCNYGVETNIEEAGKGTMVIYALRDLVSESGVVAFIEFDVIGEEGNSSEIYFTKFDVNETEASGGFQIGDSEGNEVVTRRLEVNVVQALPDKFALYQNYPNPFSRTTLIRYDLPKDTHINIQIYNVKGQLVKELVNEVETAGRKKIEWDTEGMSSGIYFCRLRTKEKTFIKKMILIH